MLAVVAALLLVVAALLGETAQAGEAEDLFEREIRPYLVERCYECHATSGTREQDLALDWAGGMREGGFSGPVLGIGNLRMVPHGYTPTDALDELVTFTDNQIDVASKAFLGMTVSCARCHNHKFDAISQADFYALFGALASSRPAIIEVDAAGRRDAARADLADLKHRLREALADAWLARVAADPAGVISGLAAGADAVAKVTWPDAPLENGVPTWVAIPTSYWKGEMAHLEIAAAGDLPVDPTDEKGSWFSVVAVDLSRARPPGGMPPGPADPVPRRFLSALDPTPFPADASGRLELAAALVAALPARRAAVGVRRPPRSRQRALLPRPAPPARRGGDPRCAAGDGRLHDARRPRYDRRPGHPRNPILVGHRRRCRRNAGGTPGGLHMMYGFSMKEVAAEERTIHGQPSWIVATDDVELAITKRGGHMAPVSFDRKAGRPIRPYHISPWQDDGLENLPAAVLVPLRGDFFCLPFGGNAAPRGEERHVPHGEAATAEWKLGARSREADGTEQLTLVLDTHVRQGTITKELFLVPGEPVVYSRHVIEGFAGPAPLGHHATLAMPEEEGVVRVSTSPFRIGMTCPGVFSDPAAKEYQALASGQTFTDLAHVPSAFKTPADVDCSRFPTRRGYADLLALVADEATLGGGPAWTAAVNTQDHWAWFAIRDARVLPTTVFWIENHGRHAMPWLGRNNCLGLEDVCGFFADGLMPSIEPNVLSKQGVRTAITLDAARPTEIRYAQAAVRVPAGFDRVRSIDFSMPGTLRLVADSGQSVSVPVRHSFVMGQGERP